MSQDPKVKIFTDRSYQLKKVRDFFYKKNILEVDTQALLKYPTIDFYIDSIKAYPSNKLHYLHTSPEYEMKKIISKGMRDIYYLGHVFRDKEKSKKHHFEFTMIEWYKSDITFEEFIKDNLKIIKLFIRFKKFEKVSYQTLFKSYLNFDCFDIRKEEFKKILKNENISLENFDFCSNEEILNLLFDYVIEKKCSKNVLYLVYDFPSNQAALAKTYIKNNIEVAFRFEFFFNGLELGNGFFELDDEKIQKERFLKILKVKKDLEIDSDFLNSLKNLGNLFGIAFGFDRLFMLKHNKKNIEDILFL